MHRRSRSIRGCATAHQAGRGRPSPCRAPRRAERCSPSVRARWIPPCASTWFRHAGRLDRGRWRSPRASPRRRRLRPRCGRITCSTSVPLARTFIAKILTRLEIRPEGQETFARGRSAHARGRRQSCTMTPAVARARAVHTKDSWSWSNPIRLSGASHLTRSTLRLPDAATGIIVGRRSRGMRYRGLASNKGCHCALFLSDQGRGAMRKKSSVGSGIPDHARFVGAPYP